jgi:hypothetical protein
MKRKIVERDRDSINEELLLYKEKELEKIKYTIEKETE